MKAGYSVCAALLLLAGPAQATTSFQSHAFAASSALRSGGAFTGPPVAHSLGAHAPIPCGMPPACSMLQLSAYKPLPQPENSATAALENTLPEPARTALQSLTQTVGGVLQGLPALPFALPLHNGFVVFLAWGVGLYVALKLLLAYRRRRAFKGAVQAGKQLILSLADRLQIRRKQLVFQNAYGTTIYDKWEREKTAFMQREMLTHLSEQGYEAYFERATPTLLAYLDQVAFDTPSAPEQKLSNPDVYSPDMDPFDYERYCARLLRQMGWEAIATSECGDQGADVVASRGNTRIILQCKLYTKAVGNDAVQQVSAARQHYGARFAAVVSNAPYTIPAQQLAKTNKVFLLHHDELQRFIRRVEKSPTFRLR
ncbi:MAG: restriction endonuclease [Acetobacter orientalis]|uniref:restriction endonuclease n=1 Tax=Acetobacter orientalis TaxID=146474 RepID=UPI0039EC86F7